jgi:flagellar hook-associated protein 1
MTQISSFLGLQTSLRGLLAQQRSLDVTAHNIANAQTPGYSRQEATLTAAPGLHVSAGAVAGGAGAVLGTGVEVGAYTRMRDGFLDLQYRAQSMGLGEKSTLSDGLSRVDEQLGEPSDTGLSGLMSSYWDSWDTLASNPADPSAKAAVVSNGKAVAGALNDLDARLAAISDSAAAEYASLATDAGNEVAGHAADLAQLNAAIKQEVTNGRQPNDLLDQRDLVLDKLSALGQVSTTDNGDGTLTVSFGGAATPLVDGATGTVTWPQTLTAPGGKLGALQTLQTTIAGYRSDLDAVAGSLASAVNGVHGTPPFFTGSTAATLAVGVTASTLQSSTSGLAGANDIAMAVAGLRKGAADNAYAALVGRIGAETASATRAAATQTSIVSTLDERRQSVSGVSMDEEMTNMVRFQRGYQASARMMSTMDEMLDTLINRTGRVGL